MDISGAGITTPLRVEIAPGFRPEYVPSLKWAMCSSGKWVASDRGASADIYRCEVGVTGYESTINELLTTIYNNRVATTGSPNQLTLTNFADTEKIFGEDVDHSSVTATVIDMGERQQGTLNNFATRLVLQAISPTFIGDSAEAITLNHWDYEYSGDAEQTISKHDSYNGSFTYIDHRADRGVYKGNAYLSIANTITLMRTIATKRAYPITTTISGVDNPFGAVRTGTWPRNLKYLEVRDMGYWGLNYHKVMIKAVEDL